MVRCAERPARHEPPASLLDARDGVDARDLQSLGDREGRQDGRDAPGEHRLAGARRADHQEVVAARDRHLDCALGERLPLHVREIVELLARLEDLLGEIRPHRLDAPLPVEVVDGLAERVDGDDAKALHDARLRGVLEGNEHLLAPDALHLKSHRQDAAHAADLPR